MPRGLKIEKQGPGLIGAKLITARRPDGEEVFLFNFFRRKLFKGSKSLRRETELLFAGVKRVGWIGQFGQEQPDRRRVSALNDLFAAEEHFANGVGATLDRE